MSPSARDVSGETADPTLRIFIAYRRDDSQGFARSIHDRLALRFGEEAVFRDINDIEPGTPWEESIDEALGSCEVFVLLVGPRWLDATDDEGNRRLDNPQDRHRREIETAIDRGIRMFVVLMEDARMPSRKLMPKAAAEGNSEGLQKVPSLHALRIADHAFDYGIGELISSIDRAVEHARADAERASAEGVTQQHDTDGEREPSDQALREEESEENWAERERWAAEIHRPSRNRRLLAFAAAAVVAVAAIVVVFLIFSSGGDDGASESAEVVGSVDVGTKPVELAGGEDGIWVTDREASTVTLITVTPEGQEVGDPVNTGGQPEGVATEGGFVWVATRDGFLSRIDPSSGDDEGFEVGNEPGTVAISAGDVWVANNGDASVSRVPLDATGPDDVTSADVGVAPYGIAIGDEFAWVTNRETDSGEPGTVSRLPLDGGDQIEPPIEVGDNPKGIDVTGDAAWVANTDSDSVTKIDAQEPNETQEFLDVGDEPRDVVVAFDFVWVTLGGDNQVARLDPATGEVEQLIDVGAGPEGITAGTDSVWVANGSAGTVVRIRP